jgi:tetratricopeptide (TPR) repeat protein
MANQDDVAQAAVQFVGSCLQVDVIANAANLGIALAGGSETLRAIRHSRRLRRFAKGLRGQLSVVARAKYSNAKKYDREAAYEAIAATLDAADFDQTLVRTAKDPQLLRNRLLGSAPDERPLLSGLSVEMYDGLLQIVVSAITREIRDSDEYLPQLVDEALKDIVDIKMATAKQQSRQEEHEDRLTQLEVDVPNAIADALRLSPSLAAAGQALKVIDRTPLAHGFFGRGDTLARISTLVGDTGYACVWGPPLAGKWELCRQWILAHAGDRDTWHVQCHSLESLAIAAAQLSKHYGLDQRATLDPLSTIQAVRESNPDVTLLLDGIQDEGAAKAVSHWKRQGSGVDLVLAGFTPAKGTQLPTIQVEVLDDPSIVGILRHYLSGSTTDDIQALAERLEGMPGLAIQAAAFITDAGVSVPQYLTMLEREPESLLHSQTTVPPRSPAVGAVWDRSLSRLETRGRASAPQLLSVLRLLGKTTISGALEGGIGFLLSGTDELGEQAAALTIIGQMNRLQLARNDEGVETASTLLMEYCWDSLSTSEKTDVARAVLRLIHLSAAYGKTWQAAGPANAVIPFVVGDCFSWRGLCPSQFDEAFVMSAQMFRSLDIPDLAIALLTQLLRAQEGTAPDAAMATTAINITNIAIEQELPEAAGFLAYVVEKFGDIEDSRVKAETRLLSGRHAWNQGEEDSVVRYCDDGLSIIAHAVLDEDSWILLKSNLHNVRAWGHAGLGNGARAIEDLRSAMRLLLSDAKFSMSLNETVLSSVPLLKDQGIDVPDDFKDMVEAALGSIVQSPDDRLPGTSLWHLGNTAQPLDPALHDEVLEYLDQGPRVSFSSGLDGLQLALFCQTQARLLLDAQNEGSPAELQALRENRDLPAETRGLYASRSVKLKELLDTGIEALEAMPSELQQEHKVRRLLAGLWINRSNYLQSVGDAEQAVRWARKALSVDTEEFGSQHQEFANDALVLGLALAQAGEAVEAMDWLSRAHTIYSTPGRNRSVPRASMVEALLRKLRK